MKVIIRKKLRTFIMEGKLIFVPTPIGNLEDFTLRSIRLLKESDAIYCEDTRETLKLLNHLEFSKPLFSYHQFNERSRVKEILNKVRTGESICIVTDQGMPGISDPGEILIKAAIEEGIEPIILPGANAVLPALVLSGFSTLTFSFLGFIPRKGKDREEFLERLKESQDTVVFYESVHRVERTLEDLKKVLKNRRICLCRELTKKFEETLRGTPEEILQKIGSRNLKGEFVFVIEGNSEEEVFTEEDIKKLLIEEINKGVKTSKAVKNISKKYDLNRNELYDFSLELKD